MNSGACLELANYMSEMHRDSQKDVSYRFSQWDPNNREKYIGTEEQWDDAQSTMQKILDDLGRGIQGRHWRSRLLRPQTGHSVQERSRQRKTPSSPFRSTRCSRKKFGMEYVDRDGQKKNPYIIHRTSIGCYETDPCPASLRNLPAHCLCGWHPSR